MRINYWNMFYWNLPFSNNVENGPQIVLDPKPDVFHDLFSEGSLKGSKKGHRALLRSLAAPFHSWRQRSSKARLAIQWLRTSGAWPSCSWKCFVVATFFRRSGNHVIDEATDSSINEVFDRLIDPAMQKLTTYESTDSLINGSG